MRLWRCRNRAGKGWWVFAPTFVEAAQYSVAVGRARKIENVQLVGDQTHFYLLDHPNEHIKEATRKLIETKNGCVGIVTLRLPSTDFVDNQYVHDNVYEWVFSSF